MFCSPLVTDMKYRKKPVVIEAVQWNGRNTAEILDFMSHKNLKLEEGALIIETLEGDMKASVGDYIIRGVDGEFYPCKPLIFQKTYTAESSVDIGKLAQDLRDLGYDLRTDLCEESLQDLSDAADILDTLVG